MNPTVDHHRPPPPPPHRPSFSCDLHPTEKFNGFCPSCLCDRLTILNPSSSATSSLFRRTKSFSASKGKELNCDPQRRSCDIAHGSINVPIQDQSRRVNWVQNDVGSARVLNNIDAGGVDEEQFRDKRVPIDVGRARVLDKDNAGAGIAGFVGRISIKDTFGVTEDQSGDKRVPIEDENVSIEEQFRDKRGQNLAHNAFKGQSRVGVSEKQFRDERVPIEVGKARNLDSYAGDEIRGRLRVGDENVSIDEKIRDKKVENEVGRGRNLAHGVGEESRGFGGGIRVRVRDPMEEKSRVIMIPIEKGRAKTLAQSVCEEIKAFEGKFRVRVPSEEERVKTLAQSVCEEIRGFKGKVRVPIEDQIVSNEERSRVKKFPVEVGRARNLGRVVADKIKVFEEQISPIEEKPRVRVPIEVLRAQTPVHDLNSEIRPFEEKFRVRVPFEAGKARAVGHNVGDEVRSQTEVSARVSECHSVGDEIRVLEEQIAPIEEQSRVRVPNEAGRAQTVAHVGGEIRAFDEEIAVDENVKSMRHYIDLDFQRKKKKPSVGFWSAASVFSKKWNKWMKKQKDKKQNPGMEKTVLPLEKPTPWKYHRETQSEVADYGMGRRSCDTEPRFSIDVGRLSVDGPRPSFEPPRASWDGHMIRRNIYSDHRVPGDTLQTHQYYLDTSSRRRRSFDRSKNSNLVNGDEVDEMKLGSNAKVTPETFDFHQRKSNSNTLRDECSEIFELGIRDDGSVIGNIEENGSKRSGRWGKKWSLWGLIYKRDKNNEDERSSRGNNGNIRCGTSENMYRRSSSVSLVSSYNMRGLSGSVRNKGVGENGHGRKKRDDLILERNRSVDNGLLRFYLTPPRSKNRIFGSRKSSGTDNLRSTPKGAYRF